MRSAIGVLLTLLGFALPAHPQTSSILTLDAMSFVSFQDEEILYLPTGATIAFTFGPANTDGSVPFTIQPGDVAVPPVDIPQGDGKVLDYGLAQAASGVMRPGENGRIIEFTGSVSATLRSGAEGGSTFVYAIPFTTETVSATSMLSNITVEITGMRLVEGVWYAQIVGATVNRENAFPKPGTAVYTILSGSFDQLPPLP